MLQVIVGICISTAIIITTELLCKKKLLSTEAGRKIAHVTVGLFFSFVALFISLKNVAILGLIDVLAVAVVYKFNLFPESRAVSRRTWGVLFFAIGIFIAALVAGSKWIFIAAVLHLAIADALAAVVGRKYGKHKYRLGNNMKTLEGSLAFLIVSICITAWVVFVAPTGLDASWLIVIWLPLLATLTEAVSPYGIDNFCLPVLVTVALRLIA